MKTFTFHGWKCAVSKSTYANGDRVALSVYDADDMEPICTASVNLPDFKSAGLDAGTHVLIKDWSENDGILDALVEAGFIEPPTRQVGTGYVFADYCKLKLEAFE
jgi:hypothetical protein